MLGDEMESLAVETKDGAVLGVTEPYCRLRNRVEHWLDILLRSGYHTQDLAGSHLVFERFLELGRSLLHLSLQTAVRVSQPLRHPVELARQRFQLVGGLDLDAMAELAGADARCAFLDLKNRFHQAPRERYARGYGDQQGQQQQTNGSPQRGIERRERFRQRLLDEREPAHRRNLGMGGEHAVAVQVRRNDRGLGVRSPGPRYANGIRGAEIELPQHQADVGMGDEMARGIHDVGDPRSAGPNLRHHVPNELEVHLGDRHGGTRPAATDGDRHVGLGVLAEVDRAEVRPRGFRLHELRFAGEISPAAKLVELQARHAQLLVPGSVETSQLGDRRRLTQQPQILEATLRGRDGTAARLSLVRPGDLLRDAVHELLDAHGGVERLLALETAEGRDTLPVGRVQLDARGDHEGATQQRHDEHDVLAEQARLHSMIRSARTSTDCGMGTPSARAVVWLTASSKRVGCSIGSSPGFAPLRILST